MTTSYQTSVLITMLSKLNLTTNRLRLHTKIQTGTQNHILIKCFRLTKKEMMTTIVMILIMKMFNLALRESHSSHGSLRIQKLTRLTISFQTSELTRTSNQLLTTKSLLKRSLDINGPTLIQKIDQSHTQLITLFQTSDKIPILSKPLI